MGWLSLISLCTLLLGVYGAGELSIIQSPESIEFTGQEEIKISNLKNVFATNLGFTVPDAERWSGLVMRDAFSYAAAIGVVSVSGVTSVDASQGKTFPLVSDMPAGEVFEELRQAVARRHPELPNVTAIHIDLSDRASAEAQVGEVNFREVPATQYLDKNLLKDSEFLKQLQLLDAITTKLCSRMCNDKKDAVVADGVPDVYWFDVTALAGVMAAHGRDSPQYTEATNLLTSSILLLSEVFNTAYDYEVVFAVISSDADVIGNRMKRQAEEKSTEKSEEPMKPDAETSDTDDDFPAMFNIFLWFNLALAFVLIAVCYGIAYMDPGRDSIIYRMTSNRMKKDN